MAIFTNASRSSVRIDVDYPANVRAMFTVYRVERVLIGVVIAFVVISCRVPSFRYQLCSSFAPARHLKS